MPSLLQSYHNGETDLDYITTRFSSLGTMLACLIYGIHVAMFAVTLQYKLRSSECPTRQNRATLIYMALVFSLATVGIALQIRWNEFIFIDNHSSGPAQFLASHVEDRVNLAKTATFIILNWLSDAMLVWRFYGIFGFNAKKVILPVMALFSPFVLSFVYLRQIAAISLNPWISTPTFPMVTSLSLSISLNACLSVLIVFRLLGMRQGLPSESPCTSIAAMFAQAAALYVACSLVFIGLCVERSFGQNILLPILCQLQAIAPLFVIMRVAQNRIWSQSEHGATTTWEVVTKPRFRPSLRLNLDFEVPKCDESDDDMPTSPVPSSSLRFSLPSPLPSAKVKKEIVPASDMLASNGARQYSNPPRYTMSQNDALVITASDILGALLETGSEESLV